MDAARKANAIAKIFLWARNSSTAQKPASSALLSLLARGTGEISMNFSYFRNHTTG
jgi:hypothetical protein